MTNGDIHFSISHCGDFAAAIVSDNAAVGIDVETISSKILNVKQRFLSEPELQLVEKIKSQFAEEAIITLFWSAKECVFKWYGKGHLSFKNNMRLKQIIAEKPGIYIDAQFIRNETTQLKIYFHFLDTLCLAWLMA